MLSDLAIRKAPSKDKPFKLHDSQGLYIFVAPTGAKLWRVDYRADGKRKTASLGRYPQMGLAEARRAGIARQVQLGARPAILLTEADTNIVRRRALVVRCRVRRRRPRGCRSHRTPRRPRARA